VTRAFPVEYKGTLLSANARRLTVATVLDKYETHYLADHEGRVSRRTITQYRHGIRRVHAWFGDLPAVGLRWPDLKPIYEAKRLSGLRVGSITTWFAIFKAAMRHAESQGDIPLCAALPPLPKSPKRKRRPTREETAAVFKKMPPDGVLGDVMGVIRATGWRSGEVLGLKSSRIVDWDGERPMIALEGTDRKTGDPLLRPIREAAVLAILVKWRARRRVGVDFVFHHQGGKPYSYAGFLAAWKVACKRAGVKNLNPHDYRRAAYDEARAAGLHPVDAMELIGHRSLATAQGYMEGGNTEQQERNLNRLERHRAAVNGVPEPAGRRERGQKRDSEASKDSKIRTIHAS
jgi:integrase